MSVGPFVAPQPNRAVMRFMTLLNEAMIVRGLPILKHCWGFRPYTRINKIVFSKSDQTNLRKLVQPGNAVFLTPNHPWFFAD